MFNLTIKITKKWRCLLAKEVFEKKMKTFVCACLCVLSHMTMRYVVECVVKTSLCVCVCVLHMNLCRIDAANHLSKNY